MIKGVGVDQCSEERIAALLAKAGVGKLAARVLTPAEQAHPKAQEARHLAGAFAAKEAVAKALGTGIGEELSFQDIELIRIPNTAPRVQVKSRPEQFHLSLTHENGMATAFVVMEQKA